MSSPPPHKRVLPHVDISEQGLRELELWLKGRTATATTGTSLVVQDEGVALPVEPIMNFVGSAVTATDDPGGTRTTVTITGGSSALPWSLSEAADNVAADFFSARSPNPLTYKHFTTTDATAFDFLNTNTPAANNGDVRILRSGLYLVRLVISSRLNAAASDPGYNWDMAVYVQGNDAGSGIYFSPDLFTLSKVQPVASYATYPSPRDNGGSPNGVSMLGRQEQHVETVTYLNLPDSVVTWPVTINARFLHGLNDGDVTVAPKYILWIFRVGDANPAAPTT